MAPHSLKTTKKLITQTKNYVYVVYLKFYYLQFAALHFKIVLLPNKIFVIEWNHIFFPPKKLTERNLETASIETIEIRYR